MSECAGLHCGASAHCPLAFPALTLSRLAPVPCVTVTEAFGGAEPASGEQLAGGSRAAPAPTLSRITLVAWNLPCGSIYTMAVGKRLNQGLPPPTPAPESQLTSTLLRLGSSVQS